MEFDNDAQRLTHERLSEYLEELFEHPFLDEKDGHFYVQYGSTVLEVGAEAYGEEDAIVTIVAYCVQEVAADPELLLGLLELNHHLPFGAFAFVDGDIFFGHNLFGRTLERSNLIRAIAAVANVSDDYDDRIVEKYGGQTALQRIGDSGSPRKQARAR